jgi:hypothetical protein
MLSPALEAILQWTLLVTISSISGWPEAACDPQAGGGQEAVEPPPASERNTIARLLEPTPAAAFVGKSLILWNGRVGVAFDTESEEWLMLPANPSAEAAEEASLLALANGHLLAAYFSDPEHTEVCVDEYLPEQKKWNALVRSPRTSLEGELPRDRFTIDGIVEVETGVVVFVGARRTPSTLWGILLPRSGEWRFISRENAPKGGWVSSFTYHRQGSVLYGGTAAVDAACAVWNLHDDQWGKRQKMYHYYDFGHCFTGEEVYAFGGAWGSMNSRVQEGGSIYSFSDEDWRPWPMEGGPEGRRGAAVCWTGEQVFVWGGIVLGEEDSWGRPRTPRNTGSLFDPTKQEWTPMTTDGAPSPRARSACVWTGKEAVIWGGWDGGERLIDAHAYDPGADRWRELPSILSGSDR